MYDYVIHLQRNVTLLLYSTSQRAVNIVYAMYDIFIYNHAIQVHILELDDSTLPQNSEVSYHYNIVCVMMLPLLSFFIKQ